MSTTLPGQNGQQEKEDHTPKRALVELSLSSKTIHSDDFLNKGQDVAPPLHVSTTYRYNRDPDKLRTLAEHNVSSCSWGKSHANTPLTEWYCSLECRYSYLFPSYHT